MKLVRLKLTLATGVLSSYVGAIQLNTKPDGTPRVVGFPIKQSLIPNSIQSNHLKRRNNVQLTIDNKQVSLKPKFAKVNNSLR
jgi:hypothetical protein